MADSETANEAVWEGAVVYFEPDRSELTGSARETLAGLLPALAANASRRMVILGHCAPYGSEAGQWRLSLDRAVAVRAFLSRNGWKPEIEPIVDGLGSSDVVASEADRQHLNRRVEIGIALHEASTSPSAVEN
jgi:outer membrane protein OmpA-like peptidoglycan-associated protein